VVTCSNCGTQLIGEFCHACGQKRFVESDRRFSHLLHLFVSSATDLDGRIWRTVRALLFHPGRLSREYFDGRRARWISPVSLFLAISVIYYIAPLHGGDFAPQFNQQMPGPIRVLAAAPDETLDEAQRSATGQPHSAITQQWVRARVEARDAAARKDSNGAHGYSYHDYRIAYDAKADDVSKALVIVHVPFVALALTLLFWPKRRYFAEHFVVALHFFSFALITLTMVTALRAALIWLLPPVHAVPEGWYDALMRTLLPLYTIVALRRAYAVGWPAAIASAAVLLAVMIGTNVFVYRTIQFLVTFALT
jgi:hypothetical protein